MDLSVIIPSRNEEFLENTIDSVLKNAKAETEVIALLDGQWPMTPLQDRKNLMLVHQSKPIGQRACVNRGARISTAKYIMKLDAHCKVAPGFDVELIKNCEPNWTVIPRMYNLHAFDWVCQSCGNRKYQGPQPEKCKQCGGQFEKKLVWKRRKVFTDFWRFDEKLKFQYWHDYKKRPESKNKICDVMSAIGACFFMERKRFFEIDGVDEKHGGWGQFGTEIACKSWLSGGRHVVNKNTWFAHMFRTQNGFKFPYPLSHKDQKRAEEYSRNLWLNNKWEKQTKKLDWLVNKFAPVPGWENGIKPTLSVMIPARNEKYLIKTIEDIKKNFTTNYEIIVGLDDWDAGELPSDVIVYRAKKRVGMRKLINKMASMANGKYIMKTDAHCAFDKGYDQKLVSMCGVGDTVLGIRYEIDVDKWEKRERTNCDFRYLSNPSVDKLGGLRGLPWHDWKKKTKGQKIAESMSLSGSGWLMLKDQFDWWGGLDLNHGTMYQEGAEIACKTWLSGGKLLINRDTWYAHWNRGKAPYSLSRKQRDLSIHYSIKLWMENRWHLQKYSFNWLLQKFNPPGWDKVTYKGVSAKRQGTNLKGIRSVDVNELWNRQVEIAEPLKRHRLEIFYLAFSEFLTTRDVSSNSRYYWYLVGHQSKSVQYKVDEKLHNRTLLKMSRGLRLFDDIKKRGMLTPLEFYQKDKNLVLFRGYRRLVILKLLGVKTAGARVHKTEEVAKKLSSPFKIETKLNKLGAKQFSKLGGHATDKYYVHNYLEVYDKCFSGLFNKRIKIIEFGVLRGASLALWHEAFPRAQIYGVDKNQTSWQKYTKGLDRIKVFVGMQEDKDFLKKQVIPNGKFDIIIDDCGHKPESQFGCFMLMWPELKPGGYYVIEDCYHSYHPKYDGMNVPKEVASWVDSIYQNFEVKSLQFHYNVCIVQKGL